MTDDQGLPPIRRLRSSVGGNDFARPVTSVWRFMLFRPPFLFDVGEVVRRAGADQWLRGVPTSLRRKAKPLAHDRSKISMATPQTARQRLGGLQEARV